MSKVGANHERIVPMNAMNMTGKQWTVMVYLPAALLLAGVPAVGQSKSSAPAVPTQSVLVVNGPGQPVPTAAQGTTNVAGTVNIGNAPSVNVANTPTVNLAAGGSVGVTNPLDGQNNPTPLAVLEAMQPYEDTCTLFFLGQSGGSCSFRAIPPGKRLVIQEFDALGFLETGLKPLSLAEVWNGSLVHNFTATFMGTSPDGARDVYATHQETRLYVPATQTPRCLITLNNYSNTSYNCQFSGFLVDVP